MLIAGRFINGLCVGICSAQVPVYISELAPPAKRGRLVGTQQWAITWGILILFYISYACQILDLFTYKYLTYTWTLGNIIPQGYRCFQDPVGCANDSGYSTLHWLSLHARIGIFSSHSYI